MEQNTNCKNHGLLVFNENLKESKNMEEFSKNTLSSGEKTSGKKSWKTRKKVFEIVNNYMLAHLNSVASNFTLIENLYFLFF